MMRITTLAAIIGVTMSSHTVLANNNDSDYFATIYQEHQSKMAERLQALRAQAANGENLVIKDGKRYLEINGTLYRLNNENYIMFDMPKPVFLDETAIRNVFGFFNNDWELTWYDGGVVAVNTRFGNYDYGNGCLLEYMPSQTTLDDSSRIIIETASCSWTMPPQQSPQAVSLVEAGDSFITLAWDRQEDAESYRIYRDNIAVANGAAIKELTFTELGLDPSTRYTYQVEACNKHGCASERSTELSVETTKTPEVLPAQPQAPVLISSGSRTAIVNWQPVAGATFYKVMRDGAVIADNLTSVSYSDARLNINTTYKYTVTACNEHGCSIESDGVTVATVANDKLDINIKHKDPKTSAVGLNVHTEQSPGVMFSANVSYSSNNVYRYGREINASGHVDGGRFRAQINQQPVNGQTCTTDAQNYKRTGGKTGEAVIDCMTKVSLVSSLKSSLEFVLADGFEYYLPLPTLYRDSDNKKIITSSFNFTSLNENVLTIGADGRITLLNEGEAIIRIEADPQYYEQRQALEYKVNVKRPTDAVVLQRIEIGQATLLSPGAPRQILAPRNSTMIRAYAYARDASNTAMPELTLTIEANGQTLSKKMICPANAKVNSFSAPSYSKNDVCYAILDSNEEKSFVADGMLLTISSESGLELITQPKVNNHGTMNLTLVPGLDANGMAKPVDTAGFDRVLRQTYPIAKTNISVRSPAQLDSNLNKALGQLDAIRKLETDGKSYFYGLVPGSCTGTVGLAYIDHVSGTGRDAGCSLYLNATFTHELGHNLAQNHAPGCGPTSSDPFWQSGAWDGVSRAALSPAPLFQQDSKTVISPKDKSIRADSDLMNYCFGFRFSEYNYKRIADHINSRSWFGDQPTRMLTVQNSEPMLLISGEIIDGKVILEPVIASNNPISANNETGNVESNYSMLVNAADGVVMYDLPLLNLDHGSNKIFSLEIPASAQINAIKFFDGERELDFEVNGLKEQKQASSRTSYSGAVVNYQSDFITWNNAKYPWLTVVHTKADGSRQSLVINATGGEFAIDQSQLVGGGSLHFSLSDGINSVIYTEELSDTAEQSGGQGDAADDAAVPGSALPAYKVGTTYQAGDQVSNAGGEFECKPFPFSGWCGGSASHYAPGTGSNWSDAWIKL
ncbi:MAG: chitinase N-terminal domain-containing protein [Shewanella sp.]